MIRNPHLMQFQLSLYIFMEWLGGKRKSELCLTDSISCSKKVTFNLDYLLDSFQKI